VDLKGRLSGRFGRKHHHGRRRISPEGAGLAGSCETRQPDTGGGSCRAGSARERPHQVHLEARRPARALLPSRSLTLKIGPCTITARGPCSDRRIDPLVRLKMATRGAG
jgi:hypothetical protein